MWEAISGVASLIAIVGGGIGLYNKKVKPKINDYKNLICTVVILESNFKDAKEEFHKTIRQYSELYKKMIDIGDEKVELTIKFELEKIKVKIEEMDKEIQKLDEWKELSQTKISLLKDK